MRSAMRATVALRRAGIRKSLAVVTDDGLLGLALHLVDGANRAKREGKRGREAALLEDVAALRRHVQDRRLARAQDRQG